MGAAEPTRPPPRTQCPSGSTPTNGGPALSFRVRDIPPAAERSTTGAFRL